MSDTGNRAIQDGFSMMPGAGRFVGLGAPREDVMGPLAGGAVWRCFVEVPGGDDRPDQPTSGFRHAQPAP